MWKVVGETEKKRTIAGGAWPFFLFPTFTACCTKQATRYVLMCLCKLCRCRSRRSARSVEMGDENKICVNWRKTKIGLKWDKYLWCHNDYLNCVFNLFLSRSEWRCRRERETLKETAKLIEKVFVVVAVVVGGSFGANEIFSSWDWDGNLQLDRMKEFHKLFLRFHLLASSFPGVVERESQIDFKEDSRW